MKKHFIDKQTRSEILRHLRNQDWLVNEKCIRDKEYMECVYDILVNPIFKEMNKYIQHGTTTTLKHCLDVSYVSYKICKSYGFDYRSAARGGLLHDLFLYDWHGYAKRTGNHFHGFTHPRVALHNAKHYFELTSKEKDIILKHMWPLTVIPPKSIEGYVVMYADKYCGFIETVKRISDNTVHMSKKVLKKA